MPRRHWRDLFLLGLGIERHGRQFFTWTVALLLLVGCGFAKDVGGEVGGTAAEWIACPTDLIDCGHVYMCDASADNELGHIEICIDDDDHPEDVDAAELMFGSCAPTPRHQGLCKWCSGPNCGRGCNALSGCFAPPE